MKKALTGECVLTYTRDELVSLTFFTMSFHKLSRKQMAGLLSYYMAKETSISAVGTKNLPLHQLEMAVRNLNLSRIA